MRNLLIPTIAVLATLVAGSHPTLAGSSSHSRNTPEVATLAQPATTLVDHVIVDDKVIRLGDLFTNAGEKSEISVA